MAYGDPVNTSKVQLKQGGNTLAVASGGTIGMDAGSTLDMSGVLASAITGSVDEGKTAGTTQSQAGGFAITKCMTRFTTVANDHDCCTLPPSVVGIDQLVIINAGAHILDIWPNAGGTTTEQINALGANTAFSINAGKVATFYCTLLGQWHSILTA